MNLLEATDRAKMKENRSNYVGSHAGKTLIFDRGVESRKGKRKRGKDGRKEASGEGERRRKKKEKR